MLTEILLILYFVFRFYLQSGEPPGLRKRSAGGVALLCLMYMGIIFAPFFILGIFPIGPCAILSIALGGLLFITEYAMEQSCARPAPAVDRSAAIFLAGQAFYLACLWAAMRLMEPYANPAPWFLGCIGDKNGLALALRLILAALICGRPAALLIRLVVDGLPKGEEGGQGNAGVGRLIGILERELIVALVFLQQYGAIGLVLTAKSIARYKQLEVQSFSEKYLVGTLSSVLLSLAVSILLLKR